jgi:hypothetical protein
LINKKFQLKNDKKKTNNNYKNKDQNYIAIEKLNFKRWNWKTNIQNKIYITIKILRIKFDIISK